MTKHLALDPFTWEYSDFGKGRYQNICQDQGQSHFTAATCGSCGLADCTCLFTGGDREGRGADGPWVWAASKELHGNLSQEYFLPRGKLTSARMGALLPRSRTSHEVSVATAKREPVSNYKLSLARTHPQPHMWSGFTLFILTCFSRPSLPALHFDKDCITPWNAKREGENGKRLHCPQAPWAMERIEQNVVKAKTHFYWVSNLKKNPKDPTSPVHAVFSELLCPQCASDIKVWKIRFLLWVPTVAACLTDSVKIWGGNR